MFLNVKYQFKICMILVWANTTLTTNISLEYANRIKLMKEYPINGVFIKHNIVQLNARKFEETFAKISEKNT